jgi:hypothetical protein
MLVAGPCKKLGSVGVLVAVELLLELVLVLDDDRPITASSAR